MTLSEELQKLAELRASGTLTEEEFIGAKERLLNAQHANSVPPSAPPYSTPPLTSTVNAFRRSRNDRWIAGVCGGIGRATGMESWVWRLFFTVLFLCGGTGLLVYFLLAIFVPSE
ncbi:MAG TPA: PspC domain-containing protein [Steroidobacteraceae bacterium]|nr:PspC domain-containing protein [Steroidobacteraceae bacterium]